MVFALAGEGEVCRLGITASRKVGGAVVRNRARRRIRELFRTRREAVTGWSGDLVVNVRRGCGEVAWQALAEDLERCVKKAQAAPRPPAP